jgi:hypothetical protein
MKLIETDKKDIFQQAITDLSKTLYPEHVLPNLQCNEPISLGFDKGFMVYHENNIQATVCSIINPHLQINNAQTVCFAFYECFDFSEISSYLLQHITDYYYKKGYKYMIGPLNGSTWNAYRFADENIKEPFISEQFHKDYYTKQLSEFGFQTAAEYVTQIDNEMKLLKTPDILNRNITFRNLAIEQYEVEMQKIYVFCKDIFKSNYLYTEISEDAFLSKYNKLKTLLNPEFVLIAEENGEIVGLLLAIHDFYSTNNKRLIIKTVGRKSGMRYAGVAHELARRITETALKHNYSCILHAFMHTNNASKNVSGKFSGKQFRKYKLFYKELI